MLSTPVDVTDARKQDSERSTVNELLAVQIRLATPL